MNREMIVFESGAGKWVAMGTPSGYTSNKTDATRFLGMADFIESTEGDRRYPDYTTYELQHYTSGFEALNVSYEG